MSIAGISRRFSLQCTISCSAANPERKILRPLVAKYHGRVVKLDEAKQWADVGMSRLAATSGTALAIAKGRVVGLLLDNNPYCRQEDRDQFAERMRKAGVPG